MLYIDCVVVCSNMHIMSKTLRLAVPPSATVQPTNWDICALCQLCGDTLIKPTAQGYATLSRNLLKLNELKHLPLNINLSRLVEDGDDVQESLSNHKAR